MRLGTIAALAGGVAGGAALVNALLARPIPPLPDRLAGERVGYRWRLGDVSFKRLGSGDPIVLLHGIHAAASAFEFHRNVEPLAELGTVYAPDLLGFGFSDRPDVPYSGALYVDLIVDFLRDVVGESATVIASSLAGAYAIVAASRAPSLVRRLILIVPTGAATLASPPGIGATLAGQLLGGSLVGPLAFDVLTSQPSLRWYLTRQAYADPRFVTDAMVDQQYATSHQPHARFAPAAFVAGRLNLDPKPALTRLDCPVMLVWGEEADLVPVEEGERLRALNPNVWLKVIERASLLPHDERADLFNPLVRDVLAPSSRSNLFGRESGGERKDAGG